MIKKIFNRLDSSNNKARALIETGEINKTCWIQAKEQYNGKGLGKNTWHSEKGQNITGSLVIFPKDIRAEDQFIISIATSLAVCDLLELYTEKVRIKWPNDIYIDKNKIAGLLIEHAILGNSVGSSILGIGININQLSFPDDIPNPTSLARILGFEIELGEVSELLLGFLVERLNQISVGEGNLLKQLYEGKLYRYRKFAPYKLQEKWLRARITGVNEFGQLILETETGEIMEFGFKEVEFIED